MGGGRFPGHVRPCICVKNMKQSNICGKDDFCLIKGDVEFKTVFFFNMACFQCVNHFKHSIIWSIQKKVKFLAHEPRFFYSKWMKQLNLCPFRATLMSTVCHLLLTTYPE